jgi:hypothetical protein
MQKFARIAEKQAYHASKVIPMENVVQLKFLNIYKNHMQKVVLQRCLGK